MTKEVKSYLLDSMIEGLMMKEVGPQIYQILDENGKRDECIDCNQETDVNQDDQEDAFNHSNDSNLDDQENAFNHLDAFNQEDDSNQEDAFNQEDEDDHSNDSNLEDSFNHKMDIYLLFS